MERFTRDSVGTTLLVQHWRYNGTLDKSKVSADVGGVWLSWKSKDFRVLQGLAPFSVMTLLNGPVV